MSEKKVLDQVTDLIKEMGIVGKTDVYNVCLTIALEFQLLEEARREDYGAQIGREVMANGVRNTFKTMFGFEVLYNMEKFEMQHKPS